MNGGTVTVTAAGTYRFTGTLIDGQIVVDAADEGVVRLILNGVDVSSANSSAVYVVDAAKVVIVLAEGTENRLSDGSQYVYADSEAEEPNAAIFSTADLTIYGEGSLSVFGNFNDAISSKDGLIIASGTLAVDAVDDGVRGKDYLIIEGGNITVDAGGIGLKSDNEEDASKGYIFVSTGAVDITSGDDALHSNNSITIDGGDIAIAAGDDAVHADTSLVVNAGTIVVTAAYEGLESADVTINGGEIDLTASDDGLNAGGGTDASGMATGNGRSGRDQFAGGETAGDYLITITGGTIIIDSEGDGVDSNGSIVMSGGTVIVHGPSRGGNGALDCNGTFDVTGGVLVAASSTADMMESITSPSTQAATAFSLTNTVQAGTLIHIQDADGISVLTFEVAKDVGALVFTSPDLTDGDTYEVYSGGKTTGESVGGLYTGGTYSAGELLGSTVAAVP